MCIDVNKIANITRRNVRGNLTRGKIANALEIQNICKSIIIILKFKLYYTCNIKTLKILAASFPYTRIVTETVIG